VLPGGLGIGRRDARPKAGAGLERLKHIVRLLPGFGVLLGTGMWRLRWGGVLGFVWFLVAAEHEEVAEGALECAVDAGFVAVQQGEGLGSGEVFH
jgi:hypothetical protein